MKKIKKTDVSALRVAISVAIAAMIQPAIADSLTPMADSELGAISGGDAIQLTLRLQNNVDENNNHIGCTPAVTGIPNPCRLGLQFSDRDPWLMLKEFYGYIGIEDARLEGAVVGGYASGGPIGPTGFGDPDRFTDGSGGCLLTTCDFDGLSALSLSYPTSKDPGVYNDLNAFVNIGRVSMEFNDGATPGYMRDEITGSALGFRMSDSSGLNANAQMRFEGRALIYGF